MSARSSKRAKIDTHPSLKIVSSGRPGAELGALEAAVKCGCNTGGWAPHGYYTDGKPNYDLRDVFGLRDSAERCHERNIEESDGTLFFRVFQDNALDCSIGFCAREKWDPLGPEEMKYAKRRYRPYFIIDNLLEPQIDRATRFIVEHRIRCLNVMGHRNDAAGLMQEKVGVIMVQILLGLGFRNNPAEEARQLKVRGVVGVSRHYPGKDLVAVPNFKNILIHTTAVNLGGELSPFVLRDEEGSILENVWQFSKVYPRVSKQHVYQSRFHPDKIIWDWPEETHVDSEGNILQEYWKWRAAGMKNEYPVRYPNGYRGRHECLHSLWPKNLEASSPNIETLDYIQARKRIYCGEYLRLAPRMGDFAKLEQLLDEGTNLLIFEVDGPDPLNPSRYPSAVDRMTKTRPYLLVTEKNVAALINDTENSFGHGFVVGALLMGILQKFL